MSKFTKDTRDLMNSQKAAFHDVLSEERYRKNETLSGLLLPNGTRVMEMRGISPALLHMYSQQLRAGTFYIRGHWEFTPDVDSIFGEFDFRERK